MSRLQFRAWDKRNEFMLEAKRIADISFKYEVLHYDSVRPERFNSIDWVPDMYIDKHGIHIDVYFDDIILMQSTGLSDKHGKDWYHSDIGEFPNGDRFVLIMEEWVEFGVQWIGEPKCEDQARDLYRVENAIWIGTIHTHNYLLGEEK